MSEKKQTAIQWLEDNMPDLSMYIPLGVSIQLHARFQQAKEMHQKQSIEDMNKMQIIQDVDFDGNVTFVFNPKQYYQENYGE